MIAPCSTGVEWNRLSWVISPRSNMTATSSCIRHNTSGCLKMRYSAYVAVAEVVSTPAK
ncbi:Uncharacterised protein [Mycobacteroides abscessus subsp. abscessus]|nr:Uncharacterised protein [Mycobacteroides abscessus subsp. abscessus]